MSYLITYNKSHRSQVFRAPIFNLHISGRPCAGRVFQRRRVPSSRVISPGYCPGLGQQPAGATLPWGTEQRHAGASSFCLRGGSGAAGGGGGEGGRRRCAGGGALHARSGRRSRRPETRLPPSPPADRRNSRPLWPHLPRARPGHTTKGARGFPGLLAICSGLLPACPFQECTRVWGI